jgi:hypothetical protein
VPEQLRVAVPWRRGGGDPAPTVHVHKEQVGEGARPELPQLPLAAEQRGAAPGRQVQRIAGGRKGWDTMGENLKARGFSSPPVNWTVLEAATAWRGVLCAELCTAHCTLHTAHLAHRIQQRG